MNKLDWRVEYKQLYEQEHKRKYPASYRDFGPPVLKLPKVSTANGLTQAIVRFLTWRGHYANRIGTQGQARVQKIPKYNILSGQMQYLEKVSYTKGNTKRGTPDISAIIGGRAVWIEVKIGKDRMSAEQVAQQTDIEDAGGIYYIAKTMEDFYEWYINRFTHH